MFVHNSFASFRRLTLIARYTIVGVYVSVCRTNRSITPSGAFH